MGVESSDGGVKVGGETGLGAALICSGGAASPTTFPETGGPLLSTVFTERNLAPP